MSAMTLRSCDWVASRNSEKLSQALRSGGIGVAVSHLPVAKRQKSSCGLTVGSIADRSTPERGSAPAVTTQAMKMKKQRTSRPNMVAG